MKRGCAEAGEGQGPKGEGRIKWADELRGRDELKGRGLRASLAYRWEWHSAGPLRLLRCGFGLQGTPVCPHGWGPPLRSLGTWGVEGPFPVPSRAQAGRGSAEYRRETPAGLTPWSPADVIHTVGPIAHGEPSASQATELRSCYLSSLDLLLEHRLRSAVRAPGTGWERPGARGHGPEGGGGRQRGVK